jgi:hypothetical protein
MAEAGRALTESDPGEDRSLEKTLPTRSSRPRARAVRMLIEQRQLASPAGRSRRNGCGSRSNGARTERDDDVAEFKATGPPRGVPIRTVRFTP